MSKLTSKGRNALPAKDFAGPGRSYPVPDKSHAAAAKSRATQAVDAGRMSSAEKSRIDARADRVLGERQNAPAGREIERRLADKDKARFGMAEIGRKTK